MSEEWLVSAAICKHCGRGIVKIENDPSAKWHHLEVHYEGGAARFGYQECRRTYAEPAEDNNR